MPVIQKLFKDKYLNIQTKPVFPLLATILLLVFSPRTNKLVNTTLPLLGQ